MLALIKPSWIMCRVQLSNNNSLCLIPMILQPFMLVNLPCINLIHFLNNFQSKANRFHLIHLLISTRKRLNLPFNPLSLSHHPISLSLNFLKAKYILRYMDKCHLDLGNINHKANNNLRINHHQGVGIVINDQPKYY